MEMLAMQKKWQTLWNGYGFEVEVLGEGFDVSNLTSHNRKLLETLLIEYPVSYAVTGDYLTVESKEITEGSWVNHLEKYMDGRTESSFRPTEIQVDKLDIFISGLVMQLNRLGYVMVYSCDGHELRRPSIDFVTSDVARKAKCLLEHVGVEVRWQGARLTFMVGREKLPTVAVQLTEITTEQAEKIEQQRDEFLSNVTFESNLETVLNIPGESGNEGIIRSYVLKALKPFVDHIGVDHFGNVLAVKRFGPGPTVLLNAHLDTVERIQSDREILKNGDIWSSSEGILGADDRAGVSVVLAAAQTLGKGLFNGTVKYIFTVEEEIGLCGAREVAKSFLWDVDMAFVIDRRGTNDIVTSRGGVDFFCTSAFGTELERIARRARYTGWATVAGGSSDTYIWARNGIESVNLSAGYQFEHTFDEQLDVAACYGTYLFLIEILMESRRLRSRNVREVS